MRTLESWLSEYSASHRHGINRLLHWVCVPAIIFSMLGILWPLQTPELLSKVLFPSNWAIVIVLLGTVYYFVLSPSLGIGMIIFFGLMLLFITWLDHLRLVLWEICVAVFIVAWIGQFIGHIVEGRRPSFFKDLQFLLIGPLWLVAAVYRKLRISY